MSKVDDELTRRLREAERPVDVGGLFEGLDRRRAHRERVRRVQVGLLAFAVLAATAGGFVALRKAFDPDARDVGQSPSPAALPANGEIVFVDEGDDVRLHIYASQPDGSDRRLLTQGDRNDADPHVAPDGRSVAFARDVDGFGRAVIATIPIEGGEIAWRSEEHYDVTDPAWSPDGSEIAFIGHTENASAELYIAEVNQDRERRIALPIDTREVAHPTWSPDGSRIVVAVYSDVGTSAMSWDLATINTDGTGLTWLASTAGSEEAPAWSPDGDRIAFLRPGAEGHEVWTVAPDGSDATLLATAVEATLGLDLGWAPDGSALLVSDGEFVYRVDAAPDGDPRENFVQLFRGFSPSWQPIPSGSQPSATISPEPDVSPSQEPEGRDIGLGFNVCRPEHLGGIDYLGDGARGNAWIGVPAEDDGTCPANPRLDAFVVAADADGDGRAETWGQLPWECNVMCVPYAATDLEGDGTEELIVASLFSIVDYYVLTYLGPPEEPSPVIVPIRLAEPAHEPAGLVAGEPLRIDAGGDAGYSSEILCEPPFLIWTWAYARVDSDDPVEKHYVELEIDGTEALVGGRVDTTVPAGEPTGVGDDTEPSCGVDWHPAA